MPKNKIDLELIENGEKLQELIELMPLLKRALHVTGLKQGPGRPKGTTKKAVGKKKTATKKKSARRGPGRPKKNA